MPFESQWRIRQFSTPESVQPYLEGMKTLLASYRNILLPVVDMNLDRDGEALLGNTLTTQPWLWGVVFDLPPDEENHEGTVYALACLSDIIPGRHAFIHGISAPRLRRHPMITALALRVFRAAFEGLGVEKVKAEFEADNRLAKGFCWRFGFRREGYFRRDIRLRGRWHDVAVYSLSRADFQAGQNMGGYNR